MSGDGLRKPNVLFLDDELDVLMGFQVSLRKAPFHTLVTTNPTEVRGLLGSQPVDVLVCDERMPAVSGSELLESLQAEFPGVARILLTGHCDLPMAMRAMRQGQLFRFLTKPVTTDVLTSAVNQALFDQTLTDLPGHVRRARARFRLLKDLEHAYPGMARELRVAADRSVNPGDALMDASEEGVS